MVTRRNPFYRRCVGSLREFLEAMGLIDLLPALNNGLSRILVSETRGSLPHYGPFAHPHRHRSLPHYGPFARNQ